MSKKVLITGGAGFLGLHLAQKLLQEDFRVDLVDNFKRAVNDQMLSDVLTDERINFNNIDLLTLSDIKKISTDYDLIVHLAAIIGVVHVLDSSKNQRHDFEGPMKFFMTIFNYYQMLLISLKNRRN